MGGRREEVPPPVPAKPPPEPPDELPPFVVAALTGAGVLVCVLLALNLLSGGGDDFYYYSKTPLAGVDTKTVCEHAHDHVGTMKSARCYSLYKLDGVSGVLFLRSICVHEAVISAGYFY